MLYVVGRVRGVTQLADIVYVVRCGSPFIEMYSADTLSPLGEGIHVEGMKDPTDIVACHCDGQLYVADKDYCIWRVSTKDHSYVKWVTAAFLVNTLSMTPQRLVVTSPDASLREYSTMNGELIRHVTLPWYVDELYHAVQTTHGSFVISHRGTSQHDWQNAVSELFRFCHTLKYCIIAS